MAWVAPKINWTSADGVADADLNRIEGNIKHIAENTQRHKVTTDEGSAIPIGSIDLNTLTKNGSYVGSGFTNAPNGETGSSFFIIVNSDTSFTYTFQQAKHATNNTWYYRVQIGGTWHPWVAVASSDIWKQKHPVTDDNGSAIDIGTFDFDNLTTTGFYRGANSVGTPSAEVYFIEVISGDGAWVTQTIYGFWTGEVYKRFRHGGEGWKPWEEIASSSNGALFNKAGVFYNNMDHYTQSGMYIMLDMSGVANTPDIGAWGILEVIQMNSYVIQAYTSVSTGRTVYRTRNDSGVWMSWKEYITSAGGVFNGDVYFQSKGYILPSIGAMWLQGSIESGTGFIVEGVPVPRTRMNNGVYEALFGTEWRPVGGIKRVQRGFVSFNAQTSMDILITAVDVSKTWVNNPNIHDITNNNSSLFINWEIVNSTTLRLHIRQGYSGSSNNISLAWEVIESY